MSISEMWLIFQWWGMLFLLTVIMLPVGIRLFSHFFDKGYILIKTLSIAILSYLVFFLGILHIVPFNQVTVCFILVALTIGNYYFFYEKEFSKKIQQILPLIIIEELLFITAMSFWVYIRGFNPEIHGLEKYMDFGFMNSILRSDSFPPKDMWLAPFTINYYYFGHLTTAVLTKLSGIPSNFTYNLMLGTIVGLCFVSSFSLGINLAKFVVSHVNAKRLYLKLAFAGLLSAFLLTFAGNIHTVYTFFKPYENEKPVPPFGFSLPIKLNKECQKGEVKNTICSNYKYSLSFNSISFSTLGFTPITFPNSYWYPNATRFIYNTIHEFPIYSWVVADLHGHVLDIPFVLLTVGFLLSLYLSSVLSEKHKNTKETVSYRFSYLVQFQNLLLLKPYLLILLGLLLAVMYMTNAWDGLIYLLLTGFIFILLGWRRITDKQLSMATFFQLVLPIGISSLSVFVFFILFSLPFSLHFKPFVSGVGVLCAPDFLIKLGSLGPFMFEVDHCQKSPLWQLIILYGFFFFFVITFLVFIRKAKLLLSDLFVLALIALSLVLIIVPEFIYVKDIYPAHYRANTMFKLVFQAFMLLSLISGYIIVRILSASKELVKTRKGTIFLFSFFPVTVVLLTLVFIYPFMATKSYYNNLQSYIGVDGTKYLEKLHPDDYKAITWINNNIKGQPVILEAQGDSYTDYGRISVHTGLPTVLGWTVHEWLWRGRYDLDETERAQVKSTDILDVPAPRITEITTLYESENEKEVTDLISKYNIEYIVVGNLEREKYPKITEKTIIKIADIAYQAGTFKLYKIR